MKRLFGLLAVLGLLVAIIVPVSAAPMSEGQDFPRYSTLRGPEPLAAEVMLTIVHTNDMHARAVENNAELGYARIAAQVKALEAQNPNVLVLDAGDSFHGLPFANLERGSSIAKMMNAVGYDYMTVGNHDFNYGFDRLLELEKEIKFPILAANVYKNGKRVFKPYEVKVVGGVRVGIFGLASPETSYKTDPKGIEGVTFSDPVAEAVQMVAELKGKADIVVLLSHLGMDDSSDPTSLSLVSKVEGINLVIDGHSHTSLATVKAKNTTRTLVAQASYYGNELGVVDLVIATDRSVKSAAARSVTAANSPDLKPDPAVKAVADAVKAAQAPLLAVKVGQTAVELVGVREKVRTGKTNLGILIANSILDISGADLALMNGGGIRDTIPVGEIRKEHIFKVLPFGNYPVTIELTGADIKAALENGVSKLPAPDGRYPHVAGATFRVDASKPVGSRVSNILVKCQPLDLAKTYVMATINFMVNGGDEYTMFKGKKLLNEYPSDAEVFLSYVQKLGLISDDNL